MRVLLKLDNGSEEVRDVKSMVILVDGWHVEMKSEQDPHLIRLDVPGRDEEFCSLVLHPYAANAMGLEIKTLPRTKSDAPRKRGR